VGNALLVEQDVLRLEVAVDEAEAVGVVQTVGNGGGDLGGARPGRGDEPAQGAAQQQLHGHDLQLLMLELVVDPGHVGMVEQVGGEKDLAGGVLVAIAARQQLEGDLAMVEGVVGAVDGSGAAPPQPLAQQVAADVVPRARLAGSGRARGGGVDGGAFEVATRVDHRRGRGGGAGRCRRCVT